MKELMNLTPAALNWLGSAFETKTKLSPLSNASGDGLTQEGLNDLIKQGVVSAEQTMITEAYAMLDILAKATKYTSVHLAGGGGHVNRISYWNDDKVVSLDNKGTTFTVSMGNDPAALEVIMNELTGANHITSSDFTGTFDYKSGLVFCGLFDLCRRAAIRLYSDGTATPDGFSAADVVKFVESASHSRWLTSHVKGINIPGFKVTQADAEKSLKGLADAGVVSVKSNLYYLAYAAAEMSNHFLFTENVVHFKCGAEKDGKVKAAECLFLQGGVHDVVMVDISADKMDVSAVSSFAMVNSLKGLMTTPPAF